jgi:hypothetical protein
VVGRSRRIKGVICHRFLNMTFDPVLSERACANKSAHDPSPRWYRLPRNGPTEEEHRERALQLITIFDVIEITDQPAYEGALPARIRMRLPSP